MLKVNLIYHCIQNIMKHNENLYINCRNTIIIINIKKHNKIEIPTSFNKMYFVNCNGQLLCYSPFIKYNRPSTNCIYAFDLENKQLKCVFQIPTNISQNGERIHIFYNNKNVFLLFQQSQNLFKINQNKKYEQISVLTAVPTQRKYISITTTSDGFLTIILVMYLQEQSEIYWINKYDNKLYKSLLNAPCFSAPLNTHIKIVANKINEKRENKLIHGYAHKNRFNIIAIIELCSKYYSTEEIYIIEPRYDEIKKSYRIFKTNITNIFKNK